jgi:hypothetical protein
MLYEILYKMAWLTGPEYILSIEHYVIFIWKNEQHFQNNLPLIFHEIIASLPGTNFHKIS